MPVFLAGNYLISCPDWCQKKLTLAWVFRHHVENLWDWITVVTKFIRALHKYIISNFFLHPSYNITLEKNYLGTLFQSPFLQKAFFSQFLSWITLSYPFYSTSGYSIMHYLCKDLHGIFINFFAPKIPLKIYICTLFCKWIRFFLTNFSLCRRFHGHCIVYGFRGFYF